MEFSAFFMSFLKKILKQHQKFASNFLMNLMKRQILFFSICVCVCVLGGGLFFLEFFMTIFFWLPRIKLFELFTV